MQSMEQIEEILSKLKLRDQIEVLIQTDSEPLQLPCFYIQHDNEKKELICGSFDRSYPDIPHQENANSFNTRNPHYKIEYQEIIMIRKSFV